MLSHVNHFHGFANKGDALPGGTILNRRVLRLSAIVGAVTVSALAVAPVFAAAPVSQATAEGLSLGIAGSPTSIGTVTSTNDGTKETKTGVTNPPISLLKGQNILGLGVVASETSATVAANGDGISAACAGLAGNGATIAAVGDSSCLAGGHSIDLSLGNIDLSKLVTIDPASVLGPLAALNPVVTSLLSPITTALSNALKSTPLGETGLTADIGAIQASCNATPGAASGTANITDVTIGADLAGTKVNLVTLPIHPAVNGPDINVDLAGLIDDILAGIKAELHTALNGVLDPANALTDAIKNDVVDALVPKLNQALAPLTTALFSLKLNQQVSSAGAIDVKALQLKVLPGLSAAGIPALLSLNVGHVTCGPNTKVAAPPTTTPTTPTGHPKPPTVVDSGLAGHNTARDVLTATAALMMLAGAAGLIGYRRMLVK
ncbi:MAG: hypothetical protein JWP74_2660 [Marmoricola sp.]|nr:hypothetical protein [Marmoricola sp.]